MRLGGPRKKTKRRKRKQERNRNEEDVDVAVDQLRNAVGKLRALSPLWDMYQDGVDLDTIEWAAH